MHCVHSDEIVLFITGLFHKNLSFWTVLKQSFLDNYLVKFSAFLHSSSYAHFFHSLRGGPQSSPFTSVIIPNITEREGLKNYVKFHNFEIFRKKKKSVSSLNYGAVVDGQKEMLREL